ncbi:ABC transporter substrate-binding protein [Cohnella laeviribosi]|uniref:ABC transporter substrate-binding protein n=1 Tax=Cohnella laeviribosi TaxID=380174 RepID=UPI0003A90623|nr:ABC transporter substrate-binding protein [Cohnella laeviribosi]
MSARVRFFSRIRSVSLASVVFTLLLTSCGISGTSTTPSDSAAQEAKSPVVIGVSGPLTGDNAEYGKQWRKGIDLALKEINANGGVKGRKLEYVFEDTQSDPKQTPAVAQKFVADSKIAAVIGDFSSPASMAASPIYQRAGLVQLGITNSHPDFTNTGDYIWSNTSNQKDDAPYLAALAVQKLNKKRLAVLYLNTDWGKTTTELFVGKAKELGAEVVVQEGYLSNEKDFRPILTKARDANPDALILISYYNDGALIAQQRDAVGLDTTVVAIGSVYSPQFIKLGGEAVEGVYTATRFYPGDPRPEVQRFVQAYQKEHNEDPDSFSAVAYDGVRILAQVMEQYGTDRKAIRDGLGSIKDLDTVLYGKASFGPDRRLQNPRFLPLVVQNGRFELWNP